MKRLCPECDAANPMQGERCYACGADLRSGLPVPLGDLFPVPAKEVAASLAVGAGVLALRTGLSLLKRFLERRRTPSALRYGGPERPPLTHRWLTRHSDVEPPSGERFPARFWGRRVRAVWRSDGTHDVDVQEVYWQAGGDGD